ncbi:MAG: hypothetical protein QXP01_00830 [Candidatus Hadarchaeum sp.]
MAMPPILLLVAEPLGVIHEASFTTVAWKWRMGDMLLASPRDSRHACVCSGRHALERSAD